MKNKVLVIVGLVAFGTGVGAGYLLGVNRLKEQYKKDCADNKDFYLNKLHEMGVMPEGFSPSEMIDRIIEDDEEAYRETKEYFEKTMEYSNESLEASSGPRGKGRPIIKYNKPPLGELRPYGDIPEEDDSMEEFDDEDEDYEAEIEARADEFAQRKHENRTNGLPYVINFDEYHDGPREYTKQTLYYYSVDRVLCEEDDTMVEDEEGLVGLDYEDVLDMQTTAWVRNDAILTMYEIQRIDDSYDQTVANVVETPREREYRILGRRKQGMDN